MDPSLQLVERYQELLARRDGDLPYDFHSLFPEGGFWTRRASQKRLAFLKKIDEPLRAMLRPGERVLFLTHAIGYSLWESYFLGLLIQYLNRRALVLTTERLLLVQIDSRLRARELRSQIELRAIVGLGRTGFGNTLLRTASGGRYVFIRLPRGDRKHLSTLAAAAGPSQAIAGGGGMQHLCPHCYAAVEGSPSECPSCNSAFKSPARAGWLSLLFPGLGDLYLGHRWFGIGGILMAACFWLTFLFAMSDPQLRGGVEIASFAATGFLLLHARGAVATLHIARKGHYAARRE